MYPGRKQGQSRAGTAHQDLRYRWVPEAGRGSAEVQNISPLCSTARGQGGLGVGSMVWGQMVAQPAWHWLLYLHFWDSQKMRVIFFFT